MKKKSLVAISAVAVAGFLALAGCKQGDHDKNSDQKMSKSSQAMSKQSSEMKTQGQNNVKGTLNPQQNKKMVTDSNKQPVKNSSQTSSY